MCDHLIEVGELFENGHLGECAMAALVDGNSSSFTNEAWDAALGHLNGCLACKKTFDKATDFLAKHS